jgi:hypothetical protein
MNLNVPPVLGALVDAGVVEAEVAVGLAVGVAVAVAVGVDVVCVDVGWVVVAGGVVVWVGEVGVVVGLPHPTRTIAHMSMITRGIKYLFTFSSSVFCY